jgi:hypothetical protein
MLVLLTSGCRVLLSCGSLFPFLTPRRVNGDSVSKISLICKMPITITQRVESSKWHCFLPPARLQTSLPTHDQRQNFWLRLRNKPSARPCHVICPNFFHLGNFLKIIFSHFLLPISVELNRYRGGSPPQRCG